MTLCPRGGRAPWVTLVLDNEAAQAVADVGHPKHRAVLAHLDGQVRRERRRGGVAPRFVPTVVRVEAGLDRRSPTSEGLGRLLVRDVALDTVRADRAVALRDLAGGSAVDSCVAELAESFDGPVTVLTSDLTDVPALLAAAGSDAVVDRL